VELKASLLLQKFLIGKEIMLAKQMNLEGSR
jgi:hypothetical protein